MTDNINKEKNKNKNISNILDNSASLSIEKKIANLFEYFNNNSINYNYINNLLSNGYPNYIYNVVPSQYNLSKWMDAVKNIYKNEHEGVARINAIKKSTSGWDIVETFSFLNWLKFYEAGDHLKYKFAQLWYENGDIPGYFLHIKKNPEKPQSGTANDSNNVDTIREDALQNQQRKDIIEKQRAKIIGRLDSAEKLLRSPDGQMFSGKEFETLLEALYQLKKKIQMVNKISSSVKLYEDMIIREANILNKKGFLKAGDMLWSLSQNLPTATPPSDPTGAGNPGAPGGLPSMGPGMPQNAPSSAVPGSAPNDGATITMLKEKPKGIQQFLEGMNTSNITSSEDVDENNIDIIDNNEVIDIVANEDFVAEAQARPAPVTEPLTTNPAPAPLTPTVTTKAPEDASKSNGNPASGDESELEVTEDDIPASPSEEKGISVSQFDHKMDEVFSQITVEDIIAKLEDLSKIFKTREVPRQLAVVDMMLDSLHMSSFFPSLAEATNKALESNNYISTRVEDILSKLRGQLATRNIDLKGNTNQSPDKPEVAALRNKLRDDEEKEKARKQKRKEQELAELDNEMKETPEVDVVNDLSKPSTPAQPPTPAPAK